MAKTIVVHARPSDCEELRNRLRPYRAAGLTFTERRTWWTLWVWTRMNINAPAELHQRVLALLAEQSNESWSNDQW